MNAAPFPPASAGRTFPLASRVTLAASAAALIALSGCAASTPTPAGGNASSAPEPSSPAAASPGSTPGSPAAGDQTGSYKDGSYSADGHYQSPNGEETIGVQLSLNGGKISDVQITTHPSSANTKLFQNRFAGGIKDEVVGKSLDEVNVSRVAGSSLTPGGFMDALSAIKKEAS